MARTFNANPYYDDFDENKNFHRILFKPGVAVQARELTQSQTILQDQISKFGNFIFRDGSKVSGANIFVDTNVKSIKLSNIAIDAYAELDGLYVISEQTEISGLVVDVNSDLLSIAVKPITNTTRNFEAGENLYFFNSKSESIGVLSAETSVYTAEVATESSISVICSSSKYSTLISCDTTSLSVGDAILSTSSVNQQKYFLHNTTIVEIIDANTIRVSTPSNATFSSVSITFTRQASKNVLEIGVTDGVFYSNGIFVKFVADKLVPNFNTQFPTISVGLNVVETVVDSYNDSSLLDPALGSYNYTAPGADRYQIFFELVSKPIAAGVIDTTDITNAKYIELVRLLDGKIQKINNTATLGEIEKTLARRTKDQSGSFVVSPFNILLDYNTPEENDGIIANISAGKAYVNGFEFETVAQTPITIDKSRDIDSIENYVLSDYYGSYIPINNYKGTNLDFFGGNKNLEVELHNVTTNLASSATKVGTAIGRNIVYDRGTNSGQIHNLYLYNINFNGSNTVSNVSSVISTVSAETFSANTNESVLYDAGYDALLFELPNKNIQAISNFTFTSEIVYEVIFSSGSTTIQSQTTNQQFMGGVGSISSPERNLYYSIVVTGTGGSYPKGTFIPMDSTGVSVTIPSKVSGALHEATVTVGNSYSGAAQIKATLLDLAPTKKLKTLHANTISELNISSVDTFYDLGKSDVVSLNAVYEYNGTYQGAWSSSTTYSINDCVVYDSEAYYSKSNTNINNNPKTTIAWQKISNTISNYVLDNGQRETHYDHGRVKSKTVTPPGNVICVFNYFSHADSGSYISFESYTSSGSNVSYKDIPSFTSPKTGKVYQLRDCIDFRPRRADSSATYTFGYNTIPFPTSQTMFDYNFYLNRIDKFVISDNKQFNIIKGVSSYTKPIPPKDRSDAMTLATLSIPAYTYNVSDISIQYSNHRRYTMDDIGALEKRISNLEYYTTLSMLEKEVAGKDVVDTSNNIQHKNGFIVDSFSGHSVGDYMNIDYNIAIDNMVGYARPSFRSNMIGYTLDMTTQNFMIGSANTGSLISFPYTEIPMVSQTVATGTTVVNAFNVISYTGTLLLSPESDIWYNTQAASNVTNTIDNTAFAAEFVKQGTVWRDYQQTFTGVTSEDVIGDNSTSMGNFSLETSDPNAKVGRTVEGVKTTTTKTGTKFSLGSTAVTRIESDALIDTKIIQYARQATVDFEAYGLSPLTKLYVYGNDTLLSGYVTPKSNPKGMIHYINVTDRGTGYTSDPTISIDGTGSVTATAKAYLDGAGGIKAIKILNPGSGYSNSIYTVSITGGNGSGAKANASTIPYRASDLFSDDKGYASGTLVIPSTDTVKFPTGKIRITVCDNPNKISQSGCYATADFRAEGIIGTTQKTITSILNPVLKTDSVKETTTSTSYVTKDISYVPNLTISDVREVINTYPLPVAASTVYTIRPDKLSVAEGEHVTFQISGQNAKVGTTLSYTVATETGNISSADLDSTSPGQMSGNFVIQSDGTATVRFTIAKDITSESEKLTVLVPNVNFDVGNSINYVTVTDYVQPISYHLEANTRSVSEGNSVMYTVTTTGISSGNIAYTVSGTNITSNDFTPTSQGQISGNVVITVNSTTGVGSGNVIFTMNADSSTEGTETMTMNLTGVTLDSTSNGQVNIVDSSVTPEPSLHQFYLCSSQNQINEGQPVVYYISPTKTDSCVALSEKLPMNTVLSWNLSKLANTNWTVNGLSPTSTASGEFRTSTPNLMVTVETAPDSISSDFTMIMTVKTPSKEVGKKPVTVMNKGNWKEIPTTKQQATSKTIIYPKTGVFSGLSRNDMIWNGYGTKMFSGQVKMFNGTKGIWYKATYNKVVDGNFIPDKKGIIVQKRAGIHPDGDAYGGGNQWDIESYTFNPATNKTTIKVIQYSCWDQNGVVSLMITSKLPEYQVLALIKSQIGSTAVQEFKIRGSLVTYDTIPGTPIKEWDPSATPPNR